MTFADQILHWIHGLKPEIVLPGDIRMMHPFRENLLIMQMVETFYRKYYSDQDRRYVIMGINPGRLGAGTTGIAFTDTYRMQEICGIEVHGLKSYEPSSVFVYKLIEYLGGPERFYHRFYITSVSPLGFIKMKESGKWLNYNYYDSRSLEEAAMPFIEENLTIQASFPLYRDICFVLGKKNAAHFEAINRRLRIFDMIEVLEHPRYIMQYKSRDMDKYLTSFAATLSKVLT
jgi:hypothetical protein